MYYLVAMSKSESFSRKLVLFSFGIDRPVLGLTTYFVRYFSRFRTVVVRAGLLKAFSVSDIVSNA